jgi:hypothetical protein
MLQGVCGHRFARSRDVTETDMGTRRVKSKRVIRINRGDPRC